MFGGLKPTLPDWLNTYPAEAGVSDLDVKYLHNFGPQIGFNIYKLLEIAESSQGQNTPLEIVIRTGKEIRFRFWLQRGQG
jgi:hypothetical protein